MNHWGWRPLILLLSFSVCVSGCRTAHETSSTIPPTEYPQITLIVRVPTNTSQPPAQTPPASPTFSPPTAVEATPTPVVYQVETGDTLLGIALNFGISLEDLQTANGDIAPQTLQIGQQLTIPNPRNTADGFPILTTPTPPPIVLDPPTCYETHADVALCLGRVENPLQQAIEQVAVMVYLFTPEGKLIAQKSAAVEQQIVPPAGSAPYRVVFNTGEQEYSGASAVLLSAVIAPQAEERFAELEIIDASGQVENSQYVLSARLYNPGMQPVRTLRLVATVSDDTGHVLGYRIVQADDVIAPGKSLPVRIPVMMQAPAQSPHHILYVEAQQSR